MICETPTTIVICCTVCFLAGLFGGSFLIFMSFDLSPLTNQRLRAELTDERRKYLERLQALQWELERATELRAGAEAQAAHFLAQRMELERRLEQPHRGFFLGCSDADRTVWRCPSRAKYDPAAVPDLWDITAGYEPIQMADYLFFVHPSGQVWALKDKYATTPYIISEVLR